MPPGPIEKPSALSDSSLKGSLLLWRHNEKGRQTLGDKETMKLGAKGAVELSRWFEKTEMVFGISECAEARKGQLCAASLKGNGIAKGNKRKWEGSLVVCATCESPRPMAIEIVRCTAIATGANARQTVTCYDCGEKGHTRNYCPKKRDPQGEEARGRAYVIRDAEKQQGPNVVTRALAAGGGVGGRQDGDGAELRGSAGGEGDGERGGHAGGMLYRFILVFWRSLLLTVSSGLCSHHLFEWEWGLLGCAVVGVGRVALTGPGEGGGQETAAG
ncbi:putative reverse transcriptase domain-containing protein [Tanacetum coccineum]